VLMSTPQQIQGRGQYHNVLYMLAHSPRRRDTLKSGCQAADL